MYYLVIDLGSGSGKIYLAHLTDENVMHMEEIDRFDMKRTFYQGHVSINIFYIYDRICGQIKKATENKIPIQAMGIDSWCCDYGIIDMESGTVSMPVFYRDSRTDGYTQKVSQIMDYKEIYARTTQREIPNSTLCQLLAYLTEYPGGLSGNKKILFPGDLLMYLFTGNIYSEVSAASYSQLYSIEKGGWQEEIFQTFKIPYSICPEVVNAGTIMGSIQPSLRKVLGTEDIKVVAPAVHDTASAAVAVPAKEGENWAFLATGSWFLMSMELEKTADIEKSYQYQLSNTGMAFDKILLKKNIMAMWLVQECKRQWDKEGSLLDYPMLAQMAEKAIPFFAMLDTEYDKFYHPDQMADEINTYLSVTGQRVPGPDRKGQIIRIIYEGIAFKSLEALRMLEDTTGRKIEVLYVVGGASRVRMLNQFLADATGITIIAGPSEATAMGNALLQAYGMGQITSLEEMREIAGASCIHERFEPQNHEEWITRYKEYSAICN